jgi:hypothetical protein
MTLRLRNLLAIGVLCTMFFPLFFPMIAPTFKSGSLANQTIVISPQRSSLDLVNTHSSESTIPRRAPMGAPSPITNYSIIASLQDTTHIVIGQTNITYVNHADVSLSELYFHLYPNAFLPNGGMEIFAILHSGLQLNYTISGIDDTILEVDLVGGFGPGLLSPGGIVTLTLDWQVEVPYSQDRFGWYNRTDPFDFLGYNLGNWHPIVAVYDDRGWDTKPYSHIGESFYSDVATYNVTITVPDDYIVAATGELQAITSGTGTRDWHFLTGPVRDFTWCASPHYETESILAQGVNVTSYFVAAHSSGGARVLEVAEECLEIFGALFGPYPWESLAIVEADIWAGGMEYPQLVMIGLPLYPNPSGISSLAYVTAHEIGHEWIPFTVGTDSYAEPWIDEGFASFTEYAWVEYVYGSEARAQYRQFDLDRYWQYVEAGGDKTLNKSMDYWQTSDWYAYGRIVYAKAALVYDMLRHQLGNQTFYDAWNYIYTEAIHQNLRTQSLQELFEEATSESLDWFFDQWVHRNGVVTLGLGAYSIQANASGWSINFQIQQHQLPTVRLRVPIRINLGTQIIELWVWIDPQPLTTHTIFVSAFPFQLELDPNRLLLCQYHFDEVLLSFAPGSPIPLAIGGAVGVAVIIAAVVIYRKRRSS